MHGRLMAFFLPVFLVVVGAFGVLLARETALRISIEADQQRTETTSELELRFLDSRFPGDVAAVQAWADGSASEGRSIIVSVDDVALDVVPSWLPAQLRSGRVLNHDAVVWPWTDGYFLTTATVDTPSGTLAIEVFDSTDPIQAAVARHWTILGATVATTVFALAAGTYGLARWALRPVRQLDAAAHSIAEGNLSARASVGPGAPELQQLADSFNTMVEKVGAGIHRERAFVASASHHFGNLLTPLRIRVETLDRKDPMVDEVLAELDRLEAVAERLIDLNRAEEHELQPVVVELGPVVDDSVRSWLAVTEARSVYLRRSGANTATAWAVPGVVEEVLDNLIDNALKYSTGSLVEVRIVQGLTNVRVMVADDGSGMSDDEIERAQGRFWRGSQHQNQPGAGLGLAIVEALASRCGGHFELRNGPNGGLECSFVLKRSREASPT